MKSLFGGVATLVRDQAPVSFGGQGGGLLSAMWAGSNNAEAQMKAMGSVGTLFAIVNRLSTAVSLVDWRLYRKNVDGRRKIGPAEDNRVEVTRHAALDLLNAPNPFTTRQELIEGGQQHIDLTGEGWLLISYLDKGHKLPGELWLVRPDKMTPVPSPTKFISGYVYTGPDGTKVPFDLDEVCFIRMPNPLDPFRGMGPVQSVMADLDATKYSAEWNRNFFLNSAEPGGIIKVDANLSDTEFQQLRMRWNEQHRGVSKAHRVAILEYGEWVPNAFSQRDMQFVQLRTASRDTIMEAFSFPKSMLGVTEDVNRANAETGEEIFGRWHQVPRLERWKSMLNNDLLPRFGATGVGVEFDYDNPVPPNAEQENADLTAKSTAAATLAGAGWNPDAVLETVGLPPMDFERPKVTIAPAPDPSAPPTPEAPPVVPPAEGEPAARASQRKAPVSDDITGATGARISAASADQRPRNEDNPARKVDLDPVAESYQHHLDALLTKWDDVKAAQVDQLATQIRDLIEANNAAGLPDMTVDTADARDALEEAMIAIGSDAADQVVDEADAQGVTIDPVQPKKSKLATAAAVIAALLGRALVTSAAKEAMRQNGADATPSAVADAVRDHLESLTDAQPRQELGGGLHQAQHAARVATFAHAESDSKSGASGVEYYASEVNDANTCGPCGREDGKDLGATVQDAEQDYPVGGYIDCDGRDRCRGHIVAVWTIGDTQ